MEKETHKWLLLDGGLGWQIVIPDSDIKPHGFPEGKKKAELAWLDCPCSPKVDYLGRMIIHNSFTDMQRIQDSMENPKIKT